MGALFGSDAMRALFSDRERLQRMLDVEAALARVEAKLGIVPPAAADAITKAARVDNLNFAELGASTRNVGYPVVALVKALGKAAGGEAPRYVHWGATTQDILDTALVLQIRDGLKLVRADLVATARALVARAQRHRNDLDGRPHPSPARFADHLRLQMRGLGRPAARRSGASRRGGRTGPARAVRRRGRHARLARRAGQGGQHRPRARSWTSRCPTRPGTSIATRWRRRPPCWRSSAAISPNSRPISSC